MLLPFLRRFFCLSFIGLCLVVSITDPSAARAAWKIDPDFRPLITSEIGPEVYAIEPAPGGKIIIAGGFTAVDDTPRLGLARLNADGTLDETFQPDPTGHRWIFAVAVQSDGKVLFGGLPPVSNLPVVHPAVVRLNSDGTHDTSFTCALIGESTVRSIKLTDDGRIVVARWSSADTETPLARLLSDGALDPAFPNSGTGVAGPVVDLDLKANGQMLVTGFFDENGAGAALFDTNGSRVTEFFGPSPMIGGPGIPSAAAIRNDGSVTLLTTVGSGIARPTLVQFDSTGAERLARNVGVNSGITLYQTILPDGDGTVVSGFQGRVLKTLERFTDAFLPDGSFGMELGDDAAQVQSSGSVHAMAFDADGAVLVGGDFTSADGMAYTGVFRLLPDTPPSRLANISARGYVGPGNDVLIAGFVVSGTEPQRVLIRAIAENLATFNVPGLATDVRLSVFRAGEGQPFHQAESFSSSPDVASVRAEWIAERLGAFPLQVTEVPGGYSSTTDAATVLTLNPGGYTVVVEATVPGIGLVEVYDANGIGADRRLVNISGRARVGTDDERVIAGFVIDRGTKRVLLRAVGPGIASMVAGALADPVIELVRQSDGARLHVNDNWSDAANAAAIDVASRQVSGLQLASGSKDAALLVDLPGGIYTMIVSGVGATTGIALVEVYEVP